jgi:surface antigen
MNTQKKLVILLASILLVITSQFANAHGYGRYWHHGGHYHGHYHGDALAAGLIVGGLFGYLISDSRYPRHRYVYYDYPAYHYPRSTVVYQRVERLPTVIKTEPVSVPANQECIMTREYTTTISIDGIAREAYGTRCMKADGTWVLGPPMFMPEQ